MKSINVLGVVFDSKLNWQIHVAKAISKAKKALYSLRLLKKFFNNCEMRVLLDAHFYSVLYYNASIWLTPSLSPDLKQSLLSVSANALRSCLTHAGFDISFDNLHKIHKKCTPTQIMYYQLALNLHKTLNQDPSDLNFEVITVLDQLVCTRRQLKFKIFRNSNSKIGFNTTANKLFYLNDKIGLELLNLTKVHFKKIAKIQFLKFGKTWSWSELQTSYKYVFCYKLVMTSNAIPWAWNFYLKSILNMCFWMCLNIITPQGNISRYLWLHLDWEM